MLLNCQRNLKIKMRQIDNEYREREPNPSIFFKGVFLCAICFEAICFEVNLILKAPYTSIRGSSFDGYQEGLKHSRLVSKSILLHDWLI